MNAPALPADRTRHDGWTADRQRDFLAAIAEGHTVDSAARTVGMSATAAYAFRRRAPGAPFALGWSAANLLARERLAASMFARAIEGQVDTLTRPDGSTYSRHRFDNRLAATMLARLDRYADDPAQAPAVAAARLVAQEFDAFLELIARDQGPARAGLFLSARAASEADLAPIVALARADRWCRAGAACAEEVDLADLDPAARAGWTAEQWRRAEAGGLFVPAPAPQAETAQGPQLSKLWREELDALYPEDDPENPVWWDDVEERWRTRFPPTDDFDGEEEVGFGEEGYSRTLSSKELAAWEAGHHAEVALREVTEGRLRDLFFGFATPTEEELALASAAAAPSGEDRENPAPAANPETPRALEPEAASPRAAGSIAMSIFGKIKDAIFGHPKAQAQAPTTPAPQGEAPAMPQIQQPAAAQPAAPAEPVDVENVLMVFETERGSADLNWRTSIVDLMKLLGLDSSLDNRKALATELGYTGATDGSAEMNIWLHKAVMAQLEKSGGKVPASLKD